MTDVNKDQPAIAWRGPTWSGGLFPTPEGMTFIRKVYGWMCIGMTINAIIAYGVYVLPSIIPYNTFVITGMILAFAIVLIGLLTTNWIAKRAYYFSSIKSCFIFVAYSTLNGFILSFIGSALRSTVAIQLFFITAALFAIMSIIGYFIKTDPTTIKRFTNITLLSIVIVILMNIALKNIPGILFIESVYVMIFLIFTLLCSPKPQKPTSGALMLCVNIYWLLSLLISMGGKQGYTPQSLWIGPQEKMDEDSNLY